MINDMPLSDSDLPVFYLRQSDLPDMLAWEIGGEYYLVAKVEMLGMEKRDDLPTEHDQTKMEGRFKVKSIRALGKQPVDIRELEKKEWRKTVARIKSGEY